MRKKIRGTNQCAYCGKALTLAPNPERIFCGTKCYELFQEEENGKEVKHFKRQILRREIKT